MKIKISLLAVLVLFFVGINAQTPYYFYNYEGKKVYLSLNTEYAFLSLKEQELPAGIEQNKIEATVLQSDNSDQKQYQMRKGTSRFWTELNFREKLSDKNYLQKLSDIKRQNNDAIISPYFKINDNDKIGLSNFFYVKLKADKDTIVLRQMSEKAKTLIIEQDMFMPLWFVLSITEFSEISTGENIAVAVFDHGIELNHPDLAANIHPVSYDSENRTSPSIVRGEHGTACAGIVGAVKNTVGISGVAPDCRLMSISSSLNLNTLNIQQHLAAGINWAWQNGADVISNSWGHNALQGAFITDAVNNAVTNGRMRNGVSLGCVVVFASGNNYTSSVSYPASLPNVLAVGAINRNGNKADYSNKDYTGKFGGTSAACPHVAGVAALVLSYNPDLTAQQVRNIIENTAQKVRTDLYTYSNNSAHPNGTWNNQVGHGLVNAYAAVQVVCPTLVNFTNQTVTTNTTVTSCGDINIENVKVQNGAKLTLDAPGEVNIGNNFEVEEDAEFEIIEK